MGRRPRVIGEEAVGGECAPVTRLFLDTTVVDRCNSVIVKTARLDAGEWGRVELLHREQVALSLLDGAGVAPNLLGSDDSDDFIVMSDAGGVTVESSLLDDDRDAGIAAVVGLGDALGRLHVATVGREGEHLRALAAAGSPRRPGERYGNWIGVQRWEDIETAATELGLPSPVVASSQRRWYAAEVAYRRRLAAAVPEAGSDRQYDEMVAIGLAAALIVRTHRLPLLASEGQGVFDSWRRRTQLLQQIGVFVDRCEKSSDLPDLAGQASVGSDGGPLARRDEAELHQIDGLSGDVCGDTQRRHGLRGLPLRLLLVARSCRYDGAVLGG